jgi:hypothetical protein
MVLRLQEDAEVEQEAPPEKPSDEREAEMGCSPQRLFGSSALERRHWLAYYHGHSMGGPCGCGKGNSETGQCRVRVQWPQGIAITGA